MSPIREVQTGLASWATGITVAISGALAPDAFSLELFLIGGCFIAIGIVLMICGAFDLLCDDFEDDIKESYNEHSN